MLLFSLWVVLPLIVLLITAAVLIVLASRRYSRLSRDRANLRISRDRANLDLQMLSRQVQNVQIQQSDTESLPDSLPAGRSVSLRKAPASSLPPGPPSSSTGQASVTEQELARPVTAGSGVAPAALAPVATSTASPHHTGSSAPRKRPAESASASRANKTAFRRPYVKFCDEQRPLLMPLGMPNQDREALLGDTALALAP